MFFGIPCVNIDGIHVDLHIIFVSGEDSQNVIDPIVAGKRLYSARCFLLVFAK